MTPQPNVIDPPPTDIGPQSSDIDPPPTDVDPQPTGIDPQPTDHSEPTLLDTPARVKFPGDDVSQCLEHKFLFAVSAQDSIAPCLPRVNMTKSVQDLVTRVNDSLEKVLQHFNPSLQQCVHLLSAAAATVSMLLPGPPVQRSNKSWKSRLENTILILRGDLSRLLTGGFPPCGGKKLMHKLRHLHSKHHIMSLSDFSVVVETLKQKISSYAARLRKYKSRLLRQWQNKLFRQNENKFYSELLKDKAVVHPSPNLTALESFWRNIFENPAKANLGSPWLRDLEGKIADKSFIVEQPVIDEVCFSNCVSRLCNWAAPGPDGIQGFCIKL